MHKKVQTLMNFVVSSLPEQQQTIIKPVVNLMQRMEQHSMYKIPHHTRNSTHPPPLRYFLNDFGSVTSYYSFEVALLQKVWSVYFLNHQTSSVPKLDEVCYPVGQNLQSSQHIGHFKVQQCGSQSSPTVYYSTSKC